MTVARRLATLVFCAALCCCGGGGQVAGGDGVGTGGTGISLGTVTGFGSVLVDGTSYSSASPQFYAQGSQTDADPAAPGDVQLGAQVQLDLDAQGNPSSVLVAPELVGLVESADASGFIVNGTRVVFNNQASAGPLTYFAGLQGPADVVNGMQVAVSGAYGLGPLGVPRVQATLVERLPDSNSISRVSGLISQLDSTAQTFVLGSMLVHYGAGTAIHPAQPGLANGVFAKAWSNQSLSNGRRLMQANGIRLRSLLGRSGGIQISGLVSHLGAAGFQLAGITVDASSSALASALAALADGQYVAVQGQMDGSSGQVRATAINAYASHPQATRIQGTITGYTGGTVFAVRGVPVDISGVQFLNGASAAGLADGVYVDISGSVGSSNAGLVQAQTLAILAQPSPGKSVVYRGQISQFSSTSQAFVLTGRVGGNTQPVAVTLAARVSYSNGTASQLANGATIEVEASQTASGLNAYSVNFLSAAPGAAQVLVRGRVDRLTATSMLVAGVPIVLGGVQPSNGVLANGLKVDVWISVAGSVYTAQSITIDP